eukprot:85124-Pelagomonas_calceolata.AAC.3
MPAVRVLRSWSAEAQVVEARPQLTRKHPVGCGHYTKASGRCSQAPADLRSFRTVQPGTTRSQKLQD